MYIEKNFYFLRFLYIWVLKSFVLIYIFAFWLNQLCRNLCVLRSFTKSPPNPRPGNDNTFKIALTTINLELSFWLHIVIDILTIWQIAKVEAWIDICQCVIMSITTIYYYLHIDSLSYVNLELSLGKCQFTVLKSKKNVNKKILNWTLLT